MTKKKIKPPRCPACNHHRPYVINTSRQGVVFHCRICSRSYTARSVTNFANSKMPQWKIEAMIAFINENPEAPIRELTRQFKVTYKTAWVFYYKVKERNEPIFMGKSKLRGYFQKSPGKRYKPHGRKKELGVIFHKNPKLRKTLLTTS